MQKDPYKTEERITANPRQQSGYPFRYFYMLSGDDSQAKPDRHVLRFLKEHTGCDYTIQQAQDVLGNTVEILKGKYPHLTVRLLDYSIWDIWRIAGKIKWPSNTISLSVIAFQRLSKQMERPASVKRSLIRSICACWTKN